MRRSLSVILVTVLAGAVLIARLAHAQHVHYLSGDDLTSGNLVHVLTPKGPRPRGVGLAPPECKHLRDKASRGIGLAPKADIASIPIQFDVNSATLTPEDEKALDTLGQALSAATLKPCCFEIDGYTDATGGAEYNQKLSEERADAVIVYLNSHEGIERERMMGKGFGKTHAVASNTTEEGRQKNRRVQVLNLGYGDVKAE